MDPTHLFTQVATITHVDPDSASPDAYGNPGEATTITYADCEIQQAQRNEDTADRDTQAEDWVLFLAPTGEDEGGYLIETELEGSDRVEVDEIAYEVIGPPWQVRNPRTEVVTHIEARLRRVV